MEDDRPDPPSPRVFLIANGFSGIVAPGECGCRLDDLMPCGVEALFRDGATGLPHGCQGGHVHTDPRGGPDWVVSLKKEPPTQEQFDEWVNAV